MGRPSRPSLTPGAQATRSQPQSSNTPQRVLPSGSGLNRLTKAPTSTVPRSLEVTAVSDITSETQTSQDEGSGQSTQTHWKRQRPKDEPWCSLLSNAGPRRPPKTAAAIEESLQNLHLSEPGHREHGGRKCAEDNASESTERRSTSIRAGNQGRRPLDGHGRRSYAEATRSSNSTRVKYGQLQWSVKVTSFLACFCCKMKSLVSGFNSPQPQSQLCQCVQDERTCRRGSADRHVVLDNTNADIRYISLQQYNELNGSAYARARNAARSRCLSGRAEKEFLWREGFAFLYPTFEAVKGLIDPYGYDVSNLDMRVLQVVDTERRQRQQQRQRVSGPHTAIAQVTNSRAAVQRIACGDPATTDHTGVVSFPGASEVDNHQGRPPVSDSPPHSYAEAVTLGPYYPESVRYHPRSATPTQTNAFERYHAAAPLGGLTDQELGFGYEDAQAGMQIRRLQESNYPRGSSHPRHDTEGSLIQSVHPRSLGSSAAYERSASSYDTPQRQVVRQTLQSGPSNAAIQEHHEFFSGPWTSLRIHERSSHGDEVQTPGLRTPSSAHQSTPGLTRELSSARTTRSSLLRPPTPGGPVSPSPQIAHPGEVHSSVVRDLEIPLQYIDPRILDKNYRLDDFDHDARS